ncbi:ORF6N domain-containing protein [Acidithiobacillus ferriphilus]|jgi:phage regulator Rha-like protein|uniref:ORF6N domain-containing protein n=1 Tax=Acidithiobacillus ferriphilus TaxID=1689834 RepID=UPI001C60B4C5|nr:ORF6N domain-containing protein [Acidithiobacillus ferriphilus]
MDNRNDKSAKTKLKERGMGSNKDTGIALRGDSLRSLIYTVRGMEVMLDSDLAGLYGVETRVFNQAVKRNIERFPESFRFHLTQVEYDSLRSQLVTLNEEPDLRSQSVTSSAHGGRRYPPYAFTEQGVAMLSAVLRSEAAIQISIHIINAFVAMRRFMAANGSLLQRMDSLEKRQIHHEINTDDRFNKVFDALESKNLNPTQGIFFDGQIFDAYVFVNDLLRQAKQSIVLIDNYIDDSVVMQLAKRRQGVSATILTKTISKQIAQDLKKHNAQYPPIQIHEFGDSHDRFLILDDKSVYHLGASLKDLGKKWFAFSRMDKSGLKVMERVDALIEANLKELGYGE